MAVCWYWGFFNLILFLYTGPQELHVFGDYSGGIVASFWSLAGLFIIYVAFLGQKKEIIYQQHEIRQSNLLFKAQEK